MDLKILSKCTDLLRNMRLMDSVSPKFPIMLDLKVKHNILYLILNFPTIYLDKFLGVCYSFD